MTVMTEQKRCPAVVVAAVDGTEVTNDVIKAAIAAARGCGGAAIHYIFVAEPPLVGDMTINTAPAREEGKKLLADVIRRTEARFAGRIEGHVAVAIPSRAILQLADDLDADVIVVGSRAKNGLSRLVSVARTIFDQAKCAVIVARLRSDARLASTRNQYESVVVGAGKPLQDSLRDHGGMSP
jgi:nucleotide-binding universal stress UspA family protein